jgi:hypothetical protein
MKRFTELFSTSLPIFIAIYLSPTTAIAQLSPRQRISINNEWRFTKGDPSDAMDQSYDIRPVIRQSGNNDLSPVPEAAQTQNIIKAWILPSGNDFTTSASKKTVRPKGNPGGNVSYVQSDFDDSKWDLVNLPHDWAIGGPFIREGGGGMGRLSSPGIGWYRRKISIPPEDLGKSIFLDVDGAMSYATVWLNEQIEIQGVCMHHDLGSLGSAVNRRAMQRQLEALVEMGVNAVRTSHNSPAPELLDMADSIGLLIMDEAFDIWEARKTPFDYHLLFNDWYEQDLRAFIRRDRNHPSIFMWSIGNEAMEQVGGEAGANLAKSLSNIVHEEDPTRPTTTAMNSARGVYTFPVSPGKGQRISSGLGLDSTNRQVSSYDVNYVDFGGFAGIV